MKPATPTTRQPSIDILRSLAIAMMVTVHFVENLSGAYGLTEGPFTGANRYWWAPTGFAAPLFTFLSGVSYRLWLAGQQRRGRDTDAVAKATIRRGLLLFLLGLAFNVLVWLPEDVFNWDILTFVGAGLIVLDTVRRLPPAVPLFACGVIVVAAPVMRELVGYSDYWSDGFFDPGFTLGDVLIGFFVTGYFPLFPWLVFPIAGYLAAPAIFSPPEDAPRSRPVLVGVSLVVAAAATVLVPRLLPAALVATPAAWTMCPASTAYVLGTLGGAILAATILHRTIDRAVAGWTDGRRSRWLDWTAALSRHSLSIYLLHHVVHLWPLWLAGLATTGAATSLWQKAVPADVAVGLAFVFLAVATALVVRLDRSGAPTTESVLRWLCD